MPLKASLAVLLLSLFACGGRTDASPKSSAELASSKAGAGSADSTDPRVKRADLDRIRGDSTAKVWLVVASDFQCPFCKIWEDSTAGYIEREYVATGKIRVAFLNFPMPMHPNAPAAAEAAMCAGAQGKFWAYHDRLFATQRQWEHVSDPAIPFDQIASAVGMDVQEHRQCIRDHVMQPMIQADRSRGSAGGVDGTPAFFIGNERISGAQPIGAFRPVIEKALAEASKGAR